MHVLKPFFAARLMLSQGQKLLENVFYTGGVPSTISSMQSIHFMRQIIWALTKLFKLLRIITVIGTLT